MYFTTTLPYHVLDRSPNRSQHQHPEQGCTFPSHHKTFNSHAGLGNLTHQAAPSFYAAEQYPSNQIRTPPSYCPTPVSIPDTNNAALRSLTSPSSMISNSNAGIPCPRCHKDCKDRREFRRHIKEVCERTEIHYCAMPGCDWGTTRPRRHLSHWRHHHPNETQQDPIFVPVGRRDIIPCPRCDYVNHDRDAFVEHYLRQHFPTNRSRQQARGRRQGSNSSNEFIERRRARAPQRAKTRYSIWQTADSTTSSSSASGEDGPVVVVNNQTQSQSRSLASTAPELGYGIVDSSRSSVPEVRGWQQEQPWTEHSAATTEIVSQYHAAQLPSASHGLMSTTMDSFDDVLSWITPDRDSDRNANDPCAADVYAGHSNVHYNVDGFYKH